MHGVSAAGREERIGRYAIQGAIAVGGMATVYYGRLIGTAGFSRGVAIKRLHPQFAADPDFVGMFLDEARLASRIHHPNVVPILDVVAEGGELFLVMDFVAGESLSKMVRAARGDMPIPVAVSIAVGILEGLHAAHEACGEDGAPLHIVHRDVSPQNVLVGMDGVAHVIDFGVAKAAGNTTMTREGQVKGKIAYMAPEQIRSQAIDRRADVYAASVVLWEMLTGKRFLGQVDSDAALVLRALNRKAQPPSAERPAIPPELDEVVLRGLHRSPDQRFATGREMAQALERVLPPAPNREVARWVDEIAGVSVRDRNHQMAAFDLSIATELPGRPLLAPTASSDESTVELAPVGPSTDRHDGADHRRSSKAWLGAAAALLIAAGLGFVVARLMPATDGDHSPTAAPEPTQVGSAALGESTPGESTPGESLGESPVESRPAAPTEVEMAATAELTTPSAKVAAPEAPPETPKAPPLIHASPGKAPAPPPSKANCSPPYLITPDGVRQYKADCL